MIQISLLYNKIKKIKNKQIETNWTTTSNPKLLHNKGNHEQNERTAYRIGEKFCKSYIK